MPIVAAQSDDPVLAPFRVGAPPRRGLRPRSMSIPRQDVPAFPAVVPRRSSTPPPAGPCMCSAGA